MTFLATCEPFSYKSVRPVNCGRLKKVSGGLRKVEGFKSSEKRLAQIFKKSRDGWKENAALKQKKLRDLEVKVRDLSIASEFVEKPS